MIMLVDDDVDMRDVCSLFLESKGYEVSVAASAAEAIQKMQGVTYELVISDCTMPDTSGVELSQSLKAHAATAQVPILLMSASARRDVADSTSYDAFLRKPFLAESLLVEVQKLLSGVAAAPNKLVQV